MVPVGKEVYIRIQKYTNYDDDEHTPSDDNTRQVDPIGTYSYTHAYGVSVPSLKWSLIFYFGAMSYKL